MYGFINVSKNCIPADISSLWGEIMWLGRDKRNVPLLLYRFFFCVIIYAFAYKYVWFLYWIIKNSNVLYPLYSIMSSKFHTNNKCQFPSISYAYVQTYSFFICLESYNINVLVMYKEVSLIPLFSCHLSNWKFIYGKFMTLLCTIPSKTVVKIIRCLFLWNNALHSCLAQVGFIFLLLPRMNNQSFMFFQNQ